MLQRARHQLADNQPGGNGGIQFLGQRLAVEPQLQALAQLIGDQELVRNLTEIAFEVNTGQVAGLVQHFVYERDREHPVAAVTPRIADVLAVQAFRLQ